MGEESRRKNMKNSVKISWLEEGRSVGACLEKSEHLVTMRRCHSEGSRTWKQRGDIQISALRLDVGTARKMNPWRQ